MKPYLLKLLSSVGLSAYCVFSVKGVEIPATYEQIDVRDSVYLSDYTSNTASDSYAFLLGQNIEVPSDMKIDGGNLLFATYAGLSPVSLEFMGGGASALTNQKLLVFDTLSRLSFSGYCEEAIHILGSLLIQNVDDGVENPDHPDVIFSGNSSTNSFYGGGAISGDYDYGRFASIELSNNGSVVFERNTSVYIGGAISVSFDSTIKLINNDSVVFERNTAASWGGAIFADFGYSDESWIKLSNNGSVVFERNRASQQGGAIFGYTMDMSNNAHILFGENEVSGSNYAAGGAIYVDGSLAVNNDGSVEFSGNTASSSNYAQGGAIWLLCELALNNNGSVEFCENSAIATAGSAMGGAIYGMVDTTIELSNNGSVKFIGNTASALNDVAGGAICAGNLSIRNNDSVLFEKNAEVRNGSYRLRSIYIGDAWDDSEIRVSLSAAKEKRIEFRDSVYIDSDSTLNLNEDYTYLDDDGAFITVKQQGDIIFTGATTVDDLFKVKGNVYGTPEEILASRTSEVYTMTNLYGGRLRVENGAIYRGQGIMAHAGSAATVLVKDATLSHDGFALTFNEGTTLQVQGESLIVGDVLMMAQSVLNLERETTINGALTLGLGMQLAGNILAEVQNLQLGESLTLVSGLESLAVQTQNLMRSVEYTTVMDGYEVQASEYFSNLAGNTGLVMRYDGEAGTVSITQTMAVPEPATATLGLLALAVLAVRRRRK